MNTYTLAALAERSVTARDARALRRIAAALHRWHELECGDERGILFRDERGRPFWETFATGECVPAPDREKQAERRLADVMARYPALSVYVSGDPRGATLWILRPDDVPALPVIRWSVLLARPARIARKDL